MKVWAFVLSVALSMTSAPASAEWSFLDKAGNGSEWFIDFATVRKDDKKTVRAWILTNRLQADQFGTMSEKALWGANCATEQIRILVYVTYSKPFGAGSALFSNYEPREWFYAAPETMHEIILTTLCGKRQ